MPFLFRTLPLFVAGAVALSAAASEFDLSRACIVRHARENPQLKAAADDLAKHLELITGVRPAEGEASAAGSSVVFRFQRPAGEPAAPKLSSYAKRDGRTVYFWGDDAMSRGCPQFGSAYAVAEFLERFLGVRWVRPGDEGIVFTRRTTCDVPDGWRWERVSGFMVSVVRGMDPEWGMRMKYAARRAFKYGHAFSKWQVRYLKAHPEYFGLNPYGRRGVEGARPHTAKLCLSNDACIDQILADWTAAGTNKFLNVCPNDGTPGYCFCEKCLALDERRPGEGFYANLTDRYLNFWNRIAARAVAIRPDAMLVTYIYSYYRHPPRRERIRFPDNMVFGVVPSLLDDQRGDLEGWKAAGLKPGTFFLRPNFTCYSGKLPRGQEREIYDSYHLYLASGSAGFDYDGRWSPVQAFEYYVIMRQIAHPEFAFERIEDEFCSQYGGLAATAKAYFARIRSRGEKSRSSLRDRMKSAGNDVLDDSLLSGFAVEGHAERDLRDDLALLEGADASGLSPEEKSRWDALTSAARGYIAAFAEAQDRARNPPAPKPEGWRASFDEPSLQGWKLRDLVGKCTVEKASFDRYSVKFTTRAEKSIALWKGGVPVTPGACYTLSFDVLAEEGAGRCGFRVVAGGKTLAAKYGTFQSGPWRRETIEFSVPDGVASATFYFVVGDGRPDVAVYLDNVVLARQDKEGT